MSISSKLKKGLYTSLIVAAGLLGAQEVKGQQILLRPPPKKVNMFQSFDTTANAKEYNKLKTREQRDSIIAVRLAEDWVDQIKYNLSSWNCNQFSEQLEINSQNYGEEIYTSSGPLYYNYTGPESDIEKLYQNGGTLKDMGKLGLPTYSLSLYDKTILKDGHEMNAILTGDDATNWDHWTFIEPQDDKMNVKPGEALLPYNCEQAKIYIKYTYNTSEHEKNLWNLKVLEFKITNGKAELIYNINTDTKIQIFFDNKPLNELVHLIEKRSEIPTSTKHQQKLENKIKVYPNPALDYVNIETTINEPTTINMEIYDITGKLVEEYHSNEYGNFKEQIDISKLQKGFYLLNIIASGKKEIYHEIVKLVKE